MIYIAIGALGFLIIHVFNIVSIKRVPWAKPIIWTVGTILLVYALVMLSFQSNTLPLPAWSIWLGLVLLSLILVSRSYLILIATPVFIIFDIIVIMVQDKFFFVRMFAGYSSYQEKTPVLLPNRQNINDFINSLKQDRTWILIG